MTASTPGADPAPDEGAPFSLCALPHWRRLAFISDLHLGPEAPRATQALCQWLAGPALQADALFILGDLFEAWIGDDLLSPKARVAAPEEAEVAQRVCNALRTWTASGRALYVQHGNRDFLLGPAFAQMTGGQLLPDPALLLFATQRLLLTHGDTLCIADTAYLQFRAQVRNPDWQRRVLSQPLRERVEQARALRAASRNAQSRMDIWADADPVEARRWLDLADCRWMIHGHTHRPRDHWEGGTLRQVLSDWDLDGAGSSPPRAEILWLDSAGAFGLDVSRSTTR